MYIYIHIQLCVCYVRACVRLYIYITQLTHKCSLEVPEPAGIEATHEQPAKEVNDKNCRNGHEQVEDHQLEELLKHERASAELEV